MAQIERREEKKGVTYLLTVNSGKDASGKQIRHRKTFTPPQTWSEARQKKAAWTEANKFEQQIKQGFALDNRQTFAQYAIYGLELKRRDGVHESTLERYEDLLKCINPQVGHLKLVDIRPGHLNKLYEQLGKESGRKKESLATAKIYGDQTAWLDQNKICGVSGHIAQSNRAGLQESNNRGYGG